MESTPGGPGYKYPSASRQTPKKHCMPPRGKRTFGADEEPAFVGDGTAQSKCQYPGEEKPDAARASSTSLAGSPISARKASAVAAVVPSTPSGCEQAGATGIEAVSQTNAADSASNAQSPTKKSVLEMMDAKRPKSNTPSKSDFWDKDYGDATKSCLQATSWASVRPEAFATLYLDMQTSANYQLLLTDSDLAATIGDKPQTMTEKMMWNISAKLPVKECSRFLRYVVFTEAQYKHVLNSVEQFLAGRGLQHVHHRSVVKFGSAPTIYYEANNTTMRLFGDIAMQYLEDLVRTQNLSADGYDKARVVWKYSAEELRTILNECDDETLAVAEEEERKVSRESTCCAIL
jgi:hypothetical protein